VNPTPDKPIEEVYSTLEVVESSRNPIVTIVSDFED